MKSSIAMLCPEFNMHRMVKQYTNEYYLVAHNRFRDLNAQNGAKAMQLAAWLSKVEKAWPRLRIDSVDESAPELALGARLELSAKVFLDTLTPEDVTVESVMGRVRADGGVNRLCFDPDAVRPTRLLRQLRLPLGSSAHCPQRYVRICHPSFAQTCALVKPVSPGLDSLGGKWSLAASQQLCRHVRSQNLKQ